MSYCCTRSSTSWPNSSATWSSREIPFPRLLAHFLGRQSRRGLDHYGLITRTPVRRHYPTSISAGQPNRTVKLPYEPYLSICNIDVVSPHCCLGKFQKKTFFLLSRQLFQLVTVHRLVLFLPFPAILVSTTPFRNRYPSFRVVRLP